MPRYSLRYLLLELALFSVSFGAFAAAPNFARPVSNLLALTSLIAFGGAVGGLFGRMLAGAILIVPLIFAMFFIAAFVAIVVATVWS